MLSQSFDYDFEGGETVEAKDLWSRWDSAIENSFATASSLVSALHQDTCVNT